MLNKIHYPSDYDGPLGIVECNRCGVKLSEDGNAIYDEDDDEFYCFYCYQDVLEERKEEE